MNQSQVKRLFEATSNSMCTDGHCVFKIFKRQRTGIHTNGGCMCLREFTAEQRIAIRLLIEAAKQSLPEDYNEQ
jgi:hypothetical protein